MHIKLVKDILTDVLIATLRYFIVPRESPRRVYTEKATYFAGGRNKLLHLDKTVFGIMIRLGRHTIEVFGKLLLTRSVRLMVYTVVDLTTLLSQV